MVDARDRRFGVVTDEMRMDRADSLTPAIGVGADAWQQGHAIQLADPTGTEHGAGGAQRRPGAAIGKASN